ncbi:MAG: hypothetical protein V3T86_07770 [Planctomycetota bacterium]
MKRWHRGLEIRPPGPPTSGKRRRVLLALLLLAGCATNATQTEKLDKLHEQFEEQAAAVVTNSLSAQVALASLKTATDVKIKEMAKALDAVAAAVATGVKGRRALSKDIEKAAKDIEKAAEDIEKAAATRAGLSTSLKVQRVLLASDLAAHKARLVGIESTANSKAKDDDRLRGESDSRQTGTNTAIGALPTTAEVRIMIDKKIDAREAVARTEIVAEANVEAKVIAEVAAAPGLRNNAETFGILVALVGAFLGYRKHQSGGAK